MARINGTEAKIQQENLQDLENSNQSYQNAQKNLALYQGNIGTLERGGSVGANPYMTPTYLAQQNKSTADAISGENSAAKQSLLMANRRSGGQNTGATQADITQLALGKSRLGNELTAGQRSQDYDKNLQFQQYLASAPLAAATGEQNLYGTATGGENSTAGDMSQYALAQYAQSNMLGNTLMKAAVNGTSMAGA